MWRALYTEYGERHAIPLDDLREHKETPDCWCGPDDEDGVWVHHSLDRRELFERGEMLVN